MRARQRLVAAEAMPAYITPDVATVLVVLLAFVAQVEAAAHILAGMLESVQCVACAKSPASSSLPVTSLPLAGACQAR